LREVITKASKKARITFADELRNALVSHYKLNLGYVTFDDLEARIVAHEAKFHGDVSQSLVLSKPEPLEKPEIVKSLGEVGSGKAEEDIDLVNTKKSLLVLRDMLAKGLQPPPSDVGAVVGLKSRNVGQLLKSVGIKAKNTRIMVCPSDST
jgi:hypothetical protein